MDGTRVREVWLALLLTVSASGCGGSSVGASGAQSGASGASGGGVGVGCGAAPAITRAAAVESVRRQTLAESPTLSPTTFFDVTEVEVPGLWDALGLQIFHARLRGSDGSAVFREVMYKGFHGEVSELFTVIGGPGLNSGIVARDTFYFSYSWGSGIWRSKVVAVSVKDCELAYRTTREYVQKRPGRELFLVNAGQSLEVESGVHADFNVWTDGEWFGRLVVTPETLDVVDASGLPIPPGM